jgi:3-oxoacyl-[acyl-carrier-protein] synthase III
MKSMIKAMHYCLPTKKVTNEDLAVRFGEKQINSIFKMAGIRERRVVTEGITASDLGYVAAQRLIDENSIDRDEIGLLIFASQTSDYQIPATACVLHDRLHLSMHCACFDINLGCTSFPYTLSVAHSMIVAGMTKKALVINADALTTVIHPMDRGLIPLHGDGAVATLLEATEDDAGFMGFSLGTDGSGYKHLIIPASGARNRRTAETAMDVADEQGCIRTQEHLYMNGPAVFHFSVYKVPEVILAGLDQIGLGIDNIDLVILHQANKMMVDIIYKALKVPPEKRFYFYESIGNLSGASTPTALAEALRQGKIKPGSITLTASFGVGLSWGVVIHKWPETMSVVSYDDVEYAKEPGDGA